MHRYATPLAIASLAIVTTACGPIRAVVAPGEQPQLLPADAPIPIEGDNGIGGEVPNGPIDITATIFVDGERAEILDLCRESDTVMRVTLDPGVFTLTDSPDSTSATYVVDGRSFEGAVEPTRGANSVTVQGNLIEDGADTALFFDATVPTSGLALCGPAEG